MPGKLDPLLGLSLPLAKARFWNTKIGQRDDCGSRSGRRQLAERLPRQAGTLPRLADRRRRKKDHLNRMTAGDVADPVFQPLLIVREWRHSFTAVNPNLHATRKG